MKNKRGYTLIEAVVTVVTIGALVAVAMPTYDRFVERSKVREGTYVLKALYAAYEGYRAEHGGNPPATLRELTVKIPSSKNFLAPYLGSNVNSYIVGLQSVRGNYILKMKQDGTITCYEGGPGICKKIGVPLW